MKLRFREHTHIITKSGDLGIFSGVREKVNVRAPFRSGSGLVARLAGERPEQREAAGDGAAPARGGGSGRGAVEGRRREARRGPPAAAVFASSGAMKSMAAEVS